MEETTSLLAVDIVVSSSDEAEAALFSWLEPEGVSIAAEVSGSLSPVVGRLGGWVEVELDGTALSEDISSTSFFLFLKLGTLDMSIFRLLSCSAGSSMLVCPDVALFTLVDSNVRPLGNVA